MQTSKWQRCPAFQNSLHFFSHPECFPLKLWTHQCKDQEIFQCPCKEMLRAHPAPMLLLWQLPRGPVPRSQTIWGGTPSWPPWGTSPQGCRARPSQARAAATMGLSGPEAGLCSMSARHRTASANLKKLMYNTELHVPAFYLLLHCSLRLCEIDSLSMFSAYSHVLKYSCLWHYIPLPRQLRRGREGNADLSGA